MAANARCDGTAIVGDAAGFIVHLEVYVDGQLVGSVDHDPGDDWYSWSIPIGEVSADADIVVIDYSAGGPGAAGFEVPLADRSACVAPTTTTTAVTSTSSTSTTTSTIAAPTSTVATTTTDTKPALPILQVDTSTTVIGCCVDEVVETVASTVATTTGNTLPATGANSTPLVGAGVLALALGIVALRTSRRRPAR